MYQESWRFFNAAIGKAIARSFRVVLVIDASFFILTKAYYQHKILFP